MSDAFYSSSSFLIMHTPSHHKKKSAGSVIGAMLCTRTEEELERDLKPDVLAPRMSIFESSWGQRIKRWYNHGTMFDQDDWHNRVR